MNLFARTRIARRFFVLRRIVLPLAGLLVAAVVLAAAVPPLIDWNNRKPEIERALSRLAGEPVSIKGNVAVKLLPTPSIDLAQLLVENHAEGLKIEADRLIVEVKLFSLLLGQVDIVASALEHPVITMLDGAVDPVTAAAAVPRAANETLKGEAQGALLGSAKLSVVDGEVRRASNGGKLLGFTLDLNYARSTGLVTGNGAVNAGGRTQKLRFSVDELAANGGHLKLLIDDEVASASAVIDGRASRDAADGKPRFEGMVDAIGSIALWNADRPRSLSWRSQSHILASGDEVRFEKIEGTLGTTPFQNSFSGQGKARLGKNLHVYLGLTSKLFDLDRLIGVGAPPVVPPFDAFTEIQQLFGQKSKTPNPFDFHADIAIDAVRTGNDDVKNFRFVASGRGEAWTIEEASGDLPGRAHLLIKGTPLDTLSVASILSGHLAIDIADQRRFFGWIDGQPATSSSAPDQPKPESINLDADAVFEPKSLWLPKLKIDFGASAFTGDARYVFPVPPKPDAQKRDRGRIGAHLAAPLVDMAVFPLGSFSETPYISPDLDLDLAIGRVLFRQLEGKGLALAFRRDGDIRSIEKLTVDDLYGAKIEASGLVEPKGSSGRLAIRSTRLDALAATVKTLMPGPLAEVLADRAPSLSPGNVDLSAVLANESGERIVQFKATGDLDQTKLMASGDWQIGPSSRRNRIDLSFDAADEVKLLRQLGFNGRLGTVVEPGQLTIKAQGNIARGYDVIFVAKAAQARMDVTGKLVFTSPTAPFDGKMVLTAPDVARLGNVIGANEALVPKNTEAKIAGRLIASPERILLTEASAEVSAKGMKLATVTGETAVHFDEKPRIAGQLKADYLDGRWLATVPLGNADAPGGAPAASGWSTTPFAAPQPPALSGDVWIEVEKLAITPELAFDSGQFVLRVKPGLLAFEKAEIRFGGGRITGDLSVARDGPVATLQSALKASDVELQRLSAIPLTTRLNGTIALAGRGQSPDELVRSIAGNGRFDLSEIRFDTVDVNAVAKLAPAVEANAAKPDAEKGLSTRLDAEMKTGAMLAPSGTLPVAVSDGTIKLGPLMVATGSGLSLSEASFDLATLKLLATTRIEAKPDGKLPSPSQALITWTGTLDQLQRKVDADPPRVEMKDVLPTGALPIGSSLPVTKPN